MAKISISEAIKLSKISRSNFYKNYIGQGLISIIIDGDKKFIETSELIRVFGEIQLEDSPREQLNTQKKTEKTQLEDKLIKTLESQLAEYKTREEWYKSQIDELRNQNNRLLEDKTTPKESKKRRKIFGIL